MGKYKCLIFDFDGTLADTNVGIVRTFQETFRGMGLTVPSVETITSTIGLALKDGFMAAMPELTDEQADRAVILYREIFPRIAYPIISAFPGVADTLHRIQAEGIVMAVASSRSHSSLDYLAEQTGVAGFFSGIYGANDIVNHKPAPDMVNLILDKLGFKPEETLVTGDATYDLLMGQGAGCRVCGVTWGNQSREQLASVNPDYIIDSIEELMDIFNSTEY